MKSRTLLVTSSMLAMSAAFAANAGDQSVHRSGGWTLWSSKETVEGGEAFVAKYFRELSPSESGSIPNHSNRLDRNMPTYPDYTLDQRTEDGRYTIKTMTDEVNGKMYHKKNEPLLFGKTRIEEPLVVSKEPVYVEQWLRPFTDYADLMEVDYYFRVIRAVRCGNYYLTCGRIRMWVPYPKTRSYQDVVRITSEVEAECRYIVDHPEIAPCPPPAAPQKTRSSFYTPWGTSPQVERSTTTSTPVFTYSVYRMNTVRINNTNVNQQWQWQGQWQQQTEGQTNVPPTGGGSITPPRPLPGEGPDTPGHNRPGEHLGTVPSHTDLFHNPPGNGQIQL